MYVRIICVLLSTLMMIFSITQENEKEEIEMTTQEMLSSEESFMKAIEKITDYSEEHPKEEIDVYSSSEPQQVEDTRSTKEKVCDMIDEVCKEMNFDRPSLIKSMVYCESSFDTNSVSYCGAAGLMQVMGKYHTETMALYGVTDLCEDSVGNLKVGIHIINRLINKYDGSLHKALVAYNCGESVVDKQGRTSNSYSYKVLRIENEYI